MDELGLHPHLRAYDEELLARYLEQEWNFDVFTYTLPGHERNLFMGANYESWIDESRKQVQYLINNGYEAITLGNLILRVETVPIYLMSVINYENME